MHPIRSLAWLACVTCALLQTGYGYGGHIQYQSPLPGARYVTPETNICLRLDGEVVPSSLRQPGLFTVRGSLSGLHAGAVILAEDGRSVIFKPVSPFLPGEGVQVRLQPGIQMRSREAEVSASFSFTIGFRVRGGPSDGFTLPEAVEPPGQMFQPERTGPGERRTNTAATDTLPLDFPYIHTEIFDSSLTGEIFISNFPIGPAIQSTPYLLILDNSGAPVFYRKMEHFCFDFKVEPNGLLTYYDFNLRQFYAMDSSYDVIDSFATGNGYDTDLHELRILENGHALMMSYDSQKVDMSTIVQGGDTAATVVGLIVQEIDHDKNVVFQWRSWDHFQITDATHENMLGHLIDYVHGNAIGLEPDGNLLVSSRHLDEITKINRTTGEIMWRLGGKNNQFTFLNDSIGFSHQHAIRRLPNGDITLFDNGNYHSPPFSRAVEYRLDEQNKTAELVWQYRNTPDNYGAAMGYVQRLDNGNTIIGWGASNPSVTEVRSDGTKVFELTMDNGVYSYRAYRFPWKPGAQGPSAGPEAYQLTQNYPNPFNISTRFYVNLQQEGVISLKLYNLAGQLVQTIANGIRKGKGSFSVNVDGSSLPSGVYFYRLIGEGFTQTRKMILAK